MVADYLEPATAENHCDSEVSVWPYAVLTSFDEWTSATGECPKSPSVTYRGIFDSSVRRRSRKVSGPRLQGGPCAPSPRSGALSVNLSKRSLRFLDQRRDQRIGLNKQTRVGLNYPIIVSGQPISGSRQSWSLTSDVHVAAADLSMNGLRWTSSVHAGLGHSRPTAKDGNYMMTCNSIR